MSDIDRELEQTRHRIHMAMLGKSKNAKDCGELTVVPLGHAVTVALEILQSHQLALLSRVKEEVIGSNENRFEESLSGHHRRSARNQMRKRLRRDIDNIAKEIRGET